jgi:hypothetical protein
MVRASYVLLFLLMTMSPMLGCEKGRYTEDRHYVGDPERIPATSEPAKESDQLRRPPAERR